MTITKDHQPVSPSEHRLHPNADSCSKCNCPEGFVVYYPTCAEYKRKMAEARHFRVSVGEVRL